ncbi:MAG: hypothetical protein LBH91_02010 [Prevotellaceae bacterium]|jgi:hypothetical protein|nr:hypothetical protein [Prevotellaceae bacterium]
MKNEIKQTKSFDVAKFETLDSNGNTLLKGGFSVAYEDNAYTGGFISLNFTKVCVCTVNQCNTVAGCGTQPTEAETIKEAEK